MQNYSVIDFWNTNDGALQEIIHLAKIYIKDYKKSKVKGNNSFWSVETVVQ